MSWGVAALFRREPVRRGWKASSRSGSTGPGRRGRGTQIDPGAALDRKARARPCQVEGHAGARDQSVAGDGERAGDHVHARAMTALSRFRTYDTVTLKAGWTRWPLLAHHAAWSCSAALTVILWNGPFLVERIRLGCACGREMERTMTGVSQVSGLSEAVSSVDQRSGSPRRVASWCRCCNTPSRQLSR
jgi:hypothetical protein